MTPTIFALSSGMPPAGIGVVRISGPQAGDVIAALTARPLPQPRRATLRPLIDPRDGRLLDEALVLWFPGPATATGEDLAEFHVHGGRAVIAAVLDCLARQPGLRAAEAGEFTRRALLNGRIDLIEAEALGDLLGAETEAQRRHALMMHDGALSRAVERWQATLLALSARLEAVLDFSDEDDVGDGVDIGGDLRVLRTELDTWLNRPRAERLKDGLRVVLAGPPNAGKSSLFNALLGRDAAIVSDIAGTTRDMIEAPVQLGGHAFVLIDVAGLRDDSGDVIEAIGIDRARRAVAAADVVLWLGDPGEAPEGALRIGAQSDRISHGSDIDLRLSAHTGEGLEELIAWLVARAAELSPRADEAGLNARQAVLISEARDAIALAGSESDPLLQAESLRASRQAFDALTGRAGAEAMLDALFGAFCIGK
ncbi:tRNA uridine-5-carboxymethylaminomethyl(34) synthesis GTPase MnmE [Sphingomonas crocodyli]|uniref:tRNA modification GTPase MnmE n=1 Tax=Sphingomonas crocodyli TaxID=1979270 RepID=A0A437MBJ1_9SPHN|nr:tRNA uridine-5-carboxymethylaminomethyl(34) synthesis GTPase MnmE [Sphingomonas crocodyli]RVT94996.1 tRNA uridine-5-carboxymethylaminomethyl(34) synthesis GTPase MnmE [Sphingomonas crocodyli]